MTRYIRILLLLFGLLYLIATAGFFVRAPWMTALWPWPDGRLSYIFLSSIMAASGAAILWIALSEDYRAIISGSLNLGLAFGGSAVYLALLARNEPALWSFAIAAGLTAVIIIALLFWARRFAPQDQRPLPKPLKFSFALFTIILVLAGLSLVLQRPNIMPWPLDPRSSVIFGLIFLGAAVYFASMFMNPVWTMARGQLLGFLAYDLILIVPFVRHLATVQPEQRLSLIIYIVVLIYSGALAIYYLFVHSETRVRTERPRLAGS